MCRVHRDSMRFQTLSSLTTCQNLCPPFHIRCMTHVMKCYEEKIHFTLPCNCFNALSFVCQCLKSVSVLVCCVHVQIVSQTKCFIITEKSKAVLSSNFFSSNFLFLLLSSVLDANPWREISKPVYVLTQKENQLCTMKTRRKIKCDSLYPVVFSLNNIWNSPT